MKRGYLIFLTGIFLYIFSGALSPLFPEGRKKKDASICSSYLVIMGESNVNRFTFTYRTTSPDSQPNQNHLVSRDEAEILIPVKEFKASNPHMYSDFLHQMQEPRFPYISIRFTDFSSGKVNSPEKRSTRKVLITLAGVTREYEIECDIVSCGDDFTIKGSEELRLTDFNIPPPEKLNGLIKVRNEITVSFSIMINFTPENPYAISR